MNTFDSTERDAATEEAMRRDEIQTKLRAFYKEDREKFKDRKRSRMGYVDLTSKECVERLEALAETVGGKIEKLSAFPKELELGPNRFNFISPEDVNEYPDRYRLLRLGDTSVILHIRDDQYFAGDRYVNNKFDGGNHDLDISEVGSLLTR